MDGTLIGGLIGFLAALLPELLVFISNHFKKPQPQPEKKVEPTVKPNADGAVNLDDVEGGVVEVAETPAHEFAEPGEKEKFHHILLEMLRGSVRPFITYGFFALFVFIHIKALYQGILVDNTPIVQLLPVIWSEGTESLLAIVLSFWFGSRAIATLRKK